MSRNPEKVSDVLALAEKLLAAAKPQEAADLIRKHGFGSAELLNAYGVALMRAGETTKALDVYRGLCVGEGGLCLKPNLPTVYKLNFATALLLARNVSGCQALLREIVATDDPYVQRLRAAIDRWRGALRWWRRLAYDWYGVEPNIPVALDFQPGALASRDELRPAA